MCSTSATPARTADRRPTGSTCSTGRARTPAPRRIAGLLARDGYSLTDEDSDADLIILIGCSIRDKAEQKLFSRLGTLQSLKTRQPGLRLGVAGCLGQREGEALLRRFPYLDLVVGNGEHLAEIPRLLRVAEVRPSSATSEPTGLFPASVDVHRDSRFRAWVGIMEGCDNFCSLCGVRHTRGRERSRPLDEILRWQSCGLAATAKSPSRPGFYIFMSVGIFVILAIGLLIVLLVSNLAK